MPRQQCALHSFVPASTSEHQRREGRGSGLAQDSNPPFPSLQRKQRYFSPAVKGYPPSLPPPNTRRWCFGVERSPALPTSLWPGVLTAKESPGHFPGSSYPLPTNCTGWATLRPLNDMVLHEKKKLTLCFTSRWQACSPPVPEVG